MGRGKFHRAVGIVIAPAAGGAAALLWFAVAAGGPHLDESPSKGLVLGVRNVLYNTDAPALRNIFAAIALALLLAAGIALLERRITNRRVARRILRRHRWRRVSSWRTPAGSSTVP